MRDDSTFTAFRVVDEAGRQDVIEVLRATYQQEKGWVGDSEQQIPVTDLQRMDISWFVVKEGPRPIGVLRVLFDPPLAAYANYGFKMLDAASISKPSSRTTGLLKSAASPCCRRTVDGSRSPLP
jgi:hypothetical protein